MDGCFKLLNSVQHYGWGSPSFLPDFLDLPNPSGDPWAELWVGAHPRCPSRLKMGGGESVGLDTWIAQNPVRALGAEAALRFGHRLPFLLKVLSAAEPLSLQVHPDAHSAAEGYAREEAAGIPQGAPHRAYADPLAKTELLVALTDFHALCGFRPSDERRELLQHLGGPWRELADPASPVDCLTRLLTAPPVSRAAFGAQLRHAAEPLVSEHPAYAWAMRLAARYPQDPGCLAPLLLNLVSLTAGQALFLEPGVLHAYLEGSGLEVMASSDNVLRAALTQKFVDIDRLVEVLNPNSCQLREIKPNWISESRLRFPPLCDAFGLEELHLYDGQLSLETSGQPELLLGAGGSLCLEEPGDQLSLGQGESVFLCAKRGSVSLRGSGKAFRVSLGESAG